VATITDEVRKAVEDDLRARWGQVGTRVIADAHGISQTSVRRIAGEAGLTAGEARANTENATAHLRSQFARDRAELQTMFAEAAKEAIREIGRGSVVTGMFFGEVVCKRVSEITASDRRNLLTAAGIAYDKAAMIDRYDAAEDGTDVAKVLRLLAGGK
jgi:hypothetical protein